MEVQTLFSWCSTYQFENFSSKLKMLFFSATSASSIIISPDFSLLSFQYDINRKNLTCLGLPHAFPCPRVVYMLPANKPLCPRQLNRFIARTFSIILGSSFKLYNRFCSPSVLLFYLLEEISMCSNISNNSDTMRCW